MSTTAPVRPQGRFGVFFERGDETAYFYLVDMDRADQRIVGAFSVGQVVRMPPEVGVRTTWTPNGDMAGLLVEGQLLAVFDLADLNADRFTGREAMPDERDRFLDG